MSLDSVKGAGVGSDIGWSQCASRLPIEIVGDGGDENASAFGWIGGLQV